MKNTKSSFLRGISCLGGGVLFVSGSIVAEPIRSALYPEDWTPAYTSDQGHFLHDFSYAGYHNGETELPDLTGMAHFDVVAGYGADATGATDATSAIQAAITAAETAGGGVVFFPAGLYRCDGLLSIHHSGIVLQGAGPDQSQVYFTRFNSMEGLSHITFTSAVSRGANLPLAQDGENRATTVYVTDASTLAPGDEIAIGWTITPEFVEEHGMTGIWTVFLNQWKPIFRREVVSVDTGVTPNAVTVNIPLRYPAKTRDGASIRKETGYMSECGVQDLGLSNAVDYLSAWTNEREHLCAFHNAKDGWIRNVHSFVSPNPANTAGYHLQNSGFLITGSKRFTVKDCRLEKAQNRGSGGCGYLYEIGASNELLIEDCAGIDGRHNFIQNWDFGTTGCVFLRCYSIGSKNMATPSLGIRADCEFHHSLSMACLIDSCRLADGWYGGNRGTESSGAGHTVTQSVYWNTDGLGTGRIRSYQYGDGYLIGTRDIALYYDISLETGPSTAPQDTVEAEGVGERIFPRSLYEDQKIRRLGGTPGTACADCSCLLTQIETEWQTVALAQAFNDNAANLPGDTIYEHWSLELAARLMCEGTHSAAAAIENAYYTNLNAFAFESSATRTTIETAPHTLALLLAISPELQDYLSGAYGLEQTYTLASPMDEQGDLDGDGVKNVLEFQYIVLIGGDRNAYISAVLSSQEHGAPLPVTGIAGLGAAVILIALLGVRLHARASA